MESEGTSVDAATAFLAELAEALTGRDGIDSDLAKVLVGHILTASPTPDCVANARAAINSLAKQRANIAAGGTSA